MRVVAEYAMRGRRQAVIVVIVAAIIPLFFWLSAAIIALITLRKGIAEGFYLTLWVTLPTVFLFFLNGNSVPFVIIAGTMLLATTLRTTISWVQTLLMVIALGVIINWLTPFLVPELLSPEVLDQFAFKVPTNTEQSSVFIGDLLMGLWSAVNLLIMLLSLILARWWQSVLFNPGGFGEEFKKILLPPLFAVPAILIAQFGGNLHPMLIGLTPIFMVPLFVASIALAHGVVSIKKLGIPWLALMYCLILLVGPYLALVDSLMNFRRRFQGMPK